MRLVIGSECFGVYFLQGSLATTATWMRNFVRSHPAYQHNSVVSQEINYDLLVAVDEM